MRSSLVVAIFGMMCAIAFGERNFKFSWDSCGQSSDPIVIKSLSVGPDPIVLGGNITISGAVTVGVAVPSAQLLITLEAQIFGIWTEIPCVDNIGSCTYDNICDYLTPDNPVCLPPFSNYGIPCQCPIPAGSYALPSITVPTKNPGLSWLTDGSYYIKAQGLDANGNELACYEVYVNLSSN